MRLKDVGESHRGLLRDLTGRISNDLEAEFSELPDADGPSVGVILRERRREVLMEIPVALLTEAIRDLTAREAVRVRIKTRRDRMLTRDFDTELTRLDAIPFHERLRPYQRDANTAALYRFPV